MRYVLTDKNWNLGSMPPLHSNFELKGSPPVSAGLRISRQLSWQGCYL